MVYVDNFNAPYGRMTMCHMIADTRQELLDMAFKIGVDLKWIQYPGTEHEHFDVCLSKKKLAIKFGAKEVTARELVTIQKQKNETKKLPGKKGCNTGDNKSGGQDEK